ncbi:MAG: hypothetical protein JWP57_4202 [Spirosoma sp.]|nr:hypothetical protein [Spirosoma sp.]
MAYNLTYKADGAVLKRFIQSRAFVRGLRHTSWALVR